MEPQIVILMAVRLMMEILGTVGEMILENLILQLCVAPVVEEKKVI